jgi:hypothetical protein
MQSATTSHAHLAHPDQAGKAWPYENVTIPGEPLPDDHADLHAAPAADEGEWLHAPPAWPWPTAARHGEHED